MYGSDKNQQLMGESFAICSNMALDFDICISLFGAMRRVCLLTKLSAIAKEDGNIDSAAQPMRSRAAWDCNPTVPSACTINEQPAFT